MNKTGKILLAIIGMLAFFSAFAKPKDIGVFSNIKTTSVRMPFYKGTKLEYFLRGRSTVMRGKLLDVVWPMIDVIRSGVAVEELAKADSNLEVYALDSPLEKVLEYWAKRTYSEGVGVSETASFDQNKRTASGTDKVFLRSPMLDINAVGFAADLSRKWVKFSSEVEIVLRNRGSRSGIAGSNKSDSKEKMSVIRAFCNEMTVDDARKIITLIGNVRVFDEEGTVTSEKLELEYGGDAEKSGSKSVGLTEKSRKNKLKLARFTGKVHAVRKLSAEEAADGEQYADADMMVYNVAAGTLEMTGSRPRIVRGKDSGEAERIVILTGKNTVARFYEKCVFVAHKKDASQMQPDRMTADYADWNQTENLIRLVGNVYINSPADKTDLRAARMAITLDDSRNGTGQRKDKDLSGSGSSISRAVAVGNVRIDRENDGVRESARGGRMTYIGAEEKIIMEQNAEVRKAGDILRGGVLTYYMKKQRLVVRNSSHITISARTAGNNNMIGKSKSAGAGEPSPITVDSDAADLNYGGNMLSFTGNVKVRGRGMLLDSDKLDITLMDAAAGAKKSADVQNSKKPVKALAQGSVHAEDDGGVLDSGVLDIRFGETAVPGKREIEKIFASGKIRLQNRSKQQPAANENFVGPTLLGSSKSGITTLDADHGTLDLLKHTADFYEHVTVYDDKVMLECEHLQFFAKPTGDVIESTASYQARDEFPDRLAVGEGRELERVLAHEKVVMTRTLPSGEVQKARGDHGRYEVKARKVYLTCDPPRKPQAVTAQGGMTGDSVAVDLDSQLVYVENGDAVGRRSK